MGLASQDPLGACRWCLSRACREHLSCGKQRAQIKHRKCVLTVLRGESSPLTAVRYSDRRSGCGIRSQTDKVSSLSSVSRYAADLFTWYSHRVVMTLGCVSREPLTFRSHGSLMNSEGTILSSSGRRTLRHSTDIRNTIAAGHGAPIGFPFVALLRTDLFRHIRDTTAVEAGGGIPVGTVLA